ncbi:MAG: peptide deformylase [Fidelibacterota bacterium]
MAVLPVIKYGDPILGRKTQPLDDFSIPKLQDLVQNMFDTMYEEEGIGLAANQVGVDLNLMVIDITHVSQSGEMSPEEGQPNPKEFDRPLVFANGEILEGWGGNAMEEGCLSLPGIRVDVERFEGVRFGFQELSGDPPRISYGKRRVEKFQGLLARVIQHEMDHLNGLVIVDRVSSLMRQQFSQQLKQIASH